MRFSFFTRDIDRCTEWRVQENLFDELAQHPLTRVILKHGENFLCKNQQLVRLPYDAVASAQYRVFLGVDTSTNERIIVQELSEASARDAEEYGEFLWLKKIGVELSDIDQHFAIESLAIMRWHYNGMYCPRCGTLTMVIEGGWARKCLQDSNIVYPRMDPSVIMLITNEEDTQVLLANNAEWAKNKYSFVAGYVDVGEHVEMAAHREAREEVGLKLSQLKYLGNQPWPFPAALMFAFKAVGTGTIKVDGVEILDAQWFTREDILTKTQSGELDPPGGLSIARHMLDAWVNYEL